MVFQWESEAGLIKSSTIQFRVYTLEGGSGVLGGRKGRWQKTLSFLSL